MAVGAKIEFEDDTLRLVSASMVVVAVWRDAPQVEHIAPMRKAQRRQQAHYGRTHFGFVNIVLSGTPSFDDELRRGLAEMLEDFREQSLCQANLILLEGLAGTATRAFMSTLNLISRSRAPTKVFKEREALETWVLERLRAHDPNASRAELVESIDRALEVRLAGS